MLLFTLIIYTIGAVLSYNLLKEAKISYFYGSTIKVFKAYVELILLAMFWFVTIPYILYKIVRGGL